MRDLRTLACAATFLALSVSVARPDLQAQVQSPDPHRHDQEALGATVEPRNTRADASAHDEDDDEMKPLTRSWPRLFRQ